MALNFRKRIKTPLGNINLSKKGIGFSTGIKGLRFGVTGDGKLRTTSSIPGTGIYYRTDKTLKSKKSESIICENCGCKVGKNDVFCKKCGYNLKNKNIKEDIKEEPTIEELPFQTIEKSKVEVKEETNSEVAVKKSENFFKGLIIFSCIMLFFILAAFFGKNPDADAGKGMIFIWLAIGIPWFCIKMAAYTRSKQ